MHFGQHLKNAVDKTADLGRELNVDRCQAIRKASYARCYEPKNSSLTCRQIK